MCVCLNRGLSPIDWAYLPWTITKTSVCVFKSGLEPNSSGLPALDKYKNQIKDNAKQKSAHVAANRLVAQPCRPVALLISADVASPNQWGANNSQNNPMRIYQLLPQQHRICSISMACSFSPPLPSLLSKLKISKASVSKPLSIPCEKRQRKSLRIVKAVSISNPELRTGPDDLVQSILSKVRYLSEKKYIYIYFLLF